MYYNIANQADRHISAWKLAANIGALRISPEDDVMEIKLKARSAANEEDKN